MIRLLNFVSSASLIGLLALCLAWELWLAPLRPGGSVLVFKALPLLLPLMGILKGKRYTYQWASLLILLYLGEGLVRATSDPGRSWIYAALEAGLATVFFFSTAYYAKLTGPSKNSRHSRESGNP